MALLDTIDEMEKLRALPEEQLPQLAEELRGEILDTVSRQGGHLASSLGAVELIVALHYTFDTPHDHLIFDVGHQAYAHKLLTGRREKFHRLRDRSGCSGFPSPAESPEFDPAVCGHAGVAISVAAGLAQADRHHHVIALVGDGSLNCGISLEGLNNASARNLLVILNDNKMSISRNVGSLQRYLNTMISGSFYNRLKVSIKHLVRLLPHYERLLRMIRRGENTLKSLLLPGSFFEELGFRYLGPLDGGDLPHLVRVLKKVRRLEGPILLHVLTEKGHGYSPAVRDPVGFHGVSGFDKATGVLRKNAGDNFSAAFGRTMVKLGTLHPEFCAISAAMVPATGLSAFASKFPQRAFDVGIAEEHAVSFAAGLAAGGMHPVCAIYSTFLQRALDGIYHDVVLAKRPVIFAIDRAGAVEDGSTHHGIYDLGFLREMPGLVILAPRCEAELELMLEYACGLNGPVAIRYPRGGTAGNQLPVSPIENGKAELLCQGDGPVIWAMGAEVTTALAAAELSGLDCTVVNARFLAPFDRELLAGQLSGNRLLVTIEDHVIPGGLASAADEVLSGLPHGKVLHFGWPGDRIIPHGRLPELRKEFGLTAESIAEKIRRESEKEK